MTRSRTAALVALMTIWAPALVAAHPGPASAAGSTITVTTTRDELNQDGDCSLREAVQAANKDARVDRCRAGNGRDRIVVPAGTFVLTKTGARESFNQTGDLDIRRSVTIEGRGRARTIIDGNAKDRLLDVFDPAVVTVSGLTLRDGAPGAGRRGGAVVVLDGASLVLRDVLVKDSFTKDGPDRFPDGGGIYNDGVLQVVDSVVRNNRAGGLEGSGGGIWSSGRLTVIRSVVSANSATGRQPGRHKIDGGGGIFASGPLTIRNSTISGNRSSFVGGGVTNGGRMSVFGSTIADNVAAQSGGGIRNLRTGTVSLDAASSVEDNTPDDCFGTTAC